LLVLSGQQYTELVSAVNAIKIALENWKLRTYRLSNVPGLGDLHPVSIIRNILSMCPDESPSKDTAELSFIEDNDLRVNLEIDISATNQALSNGEWKAATVLAGSAIEVLLLWALEQCNQKELNETVKSLLGEGRLKKDPGEDIEFWSLNSFIEVAAKLKIIGEETAQQSKLAKGYRNLIHPGREKRLGQKCDRGTALSAVAAVEHVTRDLTLQHSS